MAWQMSIFKIKGTLGGLNFYRSPDGYLVRVKPGVTKERIRQDQKLARARENGWEFGAAARAGKMLRQSFSAVTASVSDRLVSSRMQVCMLRILQTDATNKRGERTALGGDIQLLNGFNFNIKSDFEKVFQGRFETMLDRETGVARLAIHAFDPKELLGTPKRATHVQFTVAAAEVDLATGKSTLASQSSGILSLKHQCADMALETSLPAGNNKPMFLLAKITFFQEQAGEMNVLKNGKYAAATILEVEDFGSPDLKSPELITELSDAGSWMPWHIPSVKSSKPQAKISKVDSRHLKLHKKGRASPPNIAFRSQH